MIVFKNPPNITGVACLDADATFNLPRGIVVTLSIAMLFIDGEFVMRILSKRQLKEMELSD
jgi:hypothetical protein